MIGFPGGSEGIESACNVGDLSSIPGSGTSPGEENGNPLCILAWKIPWMEEPDRPQSLRSQRVTHDLVTKQQQQNLERRIRKLENE